MEEQLKKNDDINNVFEMIKKAEINIGVPPEASESDRGLYNLLIEGTEENDLRKIYRFVYSVEMGCGFFSSETNKLRSAYEEALAEDKDIVVRILNKKTKVIDIVCSCHVISKEYKMQILESHQLTNALIIYELIRQLMNQITIEEIRNSFNYKNIISKAVIKLADLDDQLFKIFIQTYEHKEQFYYIMSKVLGGLPTKGRKIYVDTIRLNSKDNNLYTYVRILLDTIEADKFDSIISDIEDTINMRWDGYLKTLLSSKEFIPGILINSYADLVLNCLCKKYQDTNLFIDDLVNVVTEFNKAINKWYNKETEFSSMYFIYATKLLFLKKVQEVNRISLSKNNDVYDKLNNLFENNRMIHYKHLNGEDLYTCFMDTN